jgi:energy-coupling factor transporter ATP-binding protein EcfA2
MGMQLRLGFAVATGVVPDILIVDEALAVGDARFQLRCLQRMQELVRAGTTLLYVSHDLATVEATCQRALLLMDGTVQHIGPTADAVAAYLRCVERGGHGGHGRPGGPGDGATVCRPGGPLSITIELPAGTDGPIPVALGIRDGHAWNVLGTSFSFGPERAGTTACCHIESLPLAAGVYQAFATTGADGAWELVHTFRVVEPDPVARPAWQPPVAFLHHWD